ncbi:conserved phage C-terminal domain-containing protein [Pediococcus ethanolidurans]|uniref:conserved phage C-terminal domain-containing protein n=1 Tax=Pediococcus ethanolidurans TaxID=319653 RepID=UPI001C1F0331|nr:conserved phage C-terminal domain-containing protein [Pediococcus ethanolidurans]MBU7562648.1 conserved phage C-terminal domain-containing protein [Pediococcus ethanolidurans]
MQGWIKLYRSLLDDPLWLLSTPVQKTVLTTLLLSVNHKETQWEWQGKKFICKPGQFITSLDSIVKKCGKGITAQNVRTALKRFENFGFLTNKSTKTGRLITIANWAKYQGDDLELTNKQQRPNKDLTPNKNVKNVKKNSDVDFKGLFEYFNLKSGKHFKNVESNRKLVRARLNDGYSKTDIKRVIDIKSAEWKNDPEHYQYLQPSTLFAPSHFDNYLNQGFPEPQGLRKQRGSAERERTATDAAAEQEEDLKAIEEKARRRLESE